MQEKIPPIELPGACIDVFGTLNLSTFASKETIKRLGIMFDMNPWRQGVAQERCYLVSENGVRCHCGDTALASLNQFGIP